MAGMLFTHPAWISVELTFSPSLHFKRIDENLQLSKKPKIT